MARWEAFAGAVLVISTTMIFLTHAASSFSRHPNWHGVMLMISTVVLWCFVIASVWRDRL